VIKTYKLAEQKGSYTPNPTGEEYGSNIHYILEHCVFCMLYTGCPGRNVPDFGRMFLKLKYNDLTKNTYIRS